MSVGSGLMTAAELWQRSGSGQRLELINGELRTMPPAGGEHGARTNYVNIPLGYYVDSQDLGIVLAAETGFVLSRDPDTVRAADVAFIRKDRIPPGGLPKQFIPFPPDLAVEVVSPSDIMDDVEDKVLQWLHAGTKLVWVVQPKHRLIKVYRSPTDVTILTDQDELSGDDVVPGFRLAAARVFR